MKKIKSSYDIPYVLLFHRAYFPIESISEIFNFKHPLENHKCFNKEKSVDFIFEDNVVINGLAGYFDSVLYSSVKMSIIPKEQSENMNSWFPIFFPSQVRKKFS